LPFFPVEWVIYTVYLSEKIGYWRYILIHRHGDIFKVLLRSQPKLWNTWQSRLWSRFFLLTVFATHTLTVHERANFYTSLGLDATTFDEDVIRHTNETAARAFPTVLDTEHPEFFARLHRCSEQNLAIAEIERTDRPKWLKVLRKLPRQLSILGHLSRIYFLKPVDAEATRGIVR
jgi:magnesium-protoporphyrin IX monomethyl ester (oxidative) cyclase